MNKLSYMAIAALAIQACTTVQAATVTATPAAVAAGTAGTASAAATGAAAEGKAAAANAAAGTVDVASGYAHATGKKAKSSWNKLKEASMGTECKLALASECAPDKDTAKSAADASKAASAAISRLQKCYMHPKSSNGCFKNIKNALAAKPGDPIYNEAYIKDVSAIVNSKPEYTKAVNDAQ